MQRRVSRAYKRLTETFRAGVIVHRCLRCDYTWRAWNRTRPAKCPGCLSDAWDRLRVTWGQPQSHRHAID